MAPLYDFECEQCFKVQEIHRPVDDRNKPVPCECGGDANLVILKVPPFKLGKGRTLSGVMEWKDREKARLTKRSNDYDKTPKGKNERMESLVRQAKRGNI